MRLYQIADAIRELLDSLDTGEVTDEQLAKLDLLGLTFDSKVDSCCGLVREWESFIAVRESEIDRLRSGIETYRNSIKRLKNYLRDNLAFIGETKHETALFKIHSQKSPPSADLDGTLPVELLDTKYRRVKYEPDARAAIEEWKASGVAPAGFVVNQGTHLRIR